MSDEEFYVAHEQRVRSFIARRVEASAVDDLHSDVWLAFLQHWDTYCMYTNPEAPLMKIARNVCVRWYKQRGRASLLWTDEEVGQAAVGAGFRPTELDVAVDLAAALSRLTPRQRTAFTLRYVDDLTRDTVAELMCISIDGVKKHLSAARKALQEDPFLVGYGLEREAG